MTLLTILSGDDAGVGSDDELAAWVSFMSVWQLPWIPDGNPLAAADLQESQWNVRLPLFDAAAATFQAAWGSNATTIAGVASGA